MSDCLLDDICFVLHHGYAPYKGAGGENRVGKCFIERSVTFFKLSTLTERNGFAFFIMINFQHEKLVLEGFKSVNHSISPVIQFLPSG